MSGGTTSVTPRRAGEEQQTTFFHESHNSNGIVLDVVVIHRATVPPPRESGLRALVRMLRFIWECVNHGPASEPWQDEAEPGWENASGVGGPFKVRFNADRRLVRAAGREFALPRTGALVVLIDRHDVSDEGAEVTTTVLFLAPRQHALFSASGNSRSERRAHRRHMEDTLAAWKQALDNDLVVRAFRARRGMGAAAAT